MIRLTKKQIIIMHAQLIEETGGTKGLRDVHLLDSALNAPFLSFGGITNFPTIQQKAARLGFGLVQNHPFIDGNKRIGAHVMLVFLTLNNIELEYTQEELAYIFFKIASNEKTYEELLKWIIAHQI